MKFCLFSLFCKCKNEPSVTLHVPSKHVKKIKELLDKANKERTFTAHYNMFKFIEEILPDTKEGNWRIVNTDAVSIDLIKLEK